MGYNPRPLLNSLVSISRGWGIEKSLIWENWWFLLLRINDMPSSGTLV